MNLFFSADWETASDRTDTERGNEGGRKGGDLHRQPAKQAGGRTRKRTREDLIQLRPDLCSCDLGGKDDANDALPEEEGDGEN